MSRRVEITGIHPHHPTQSDWWIVCYRVTTYTHVTETEMWVKAVDELGAAQGFMKTSVWNPANE